MGEDRSPGRRVQLGLDDFTAGTASKPVNQTLVCKLETSRWKREYVRDAIDEWQRVLKFMYEQLPSYDTALWGSKPPEWSGSPRNHTHTRRQISDRFSDNPLYANLNYGAAYVAGARFNTWHENGREGSRPRPQNTSYINLPSHHTCRPVVAQNDRGFGLRIKLCSGDDPLWFHIAAGEYQRRRLQRVVDGDYSLGSGELHFEGGDLYAHLHLSWSVDVYKPADVTRWVGVDRGIDALYAAAAISARDTDAGGIEVLEVDVQPGREYFHHRKRIEHKRAELQRKGALAKAKVQGLYADYTEQMLDECSRAVVDLADRHRPCGIALEDLTRARETSGGRFHDYPYGELHAKIAYKAREKGIPIKDVNPHNTSIECRKCGHEDAANRNGTDFYCRRCTYEVHADVNAAMNIAKRAFGEAS